MLLGHLICQGCEDYWKSWHLESLQYPRISLVQEIGLSVHVGRISGSWPAPFWGCSSAAPLPSFSKVEMGLHQNMLAAWRKTWTLYAKFCHSLTVSCKYIVFKGTSSFYQLLAISFATPDQPSFPFLQSVEWKRLFREFLSTWFICEKRCITPVGLSQYSLIGSLLAGLVVSVSHLERLRENKPTLSSFNGQCRTVVRSMHSEAIFTGLESEPHLCQLCDHLG